MHLILTDSETRVLGALVEKSVTTPEYYPLTLNALVAACNQKSNRDPVTQYDARTVNDALEGLRDKGLARVILGGDSRVPKYRHYFDEAMDTSPAETAVLCELMVRGPQTPGELRGRLERFGINLMLDELEVVLDALAAREPPFTVKLPRQPGRREARYAHLLAGAPSLPEGDAAPDPIAAAGPTTGERITRLEATVEALRDELAAVRQQLEALCRQWE